MADEMMYSVTGNPFVDTGQAVIAHLAGRESFTQMTHGDVKRVFGSGDDLADWNSRLKSFTMVFGNNGPLYQPRGKQHEDSRKKKYASILAGLSDQIENTNPGLGVCECCGEFHTCDLNAAYEQVDEGKHNDHAIGRFKSDRCGIIFIRAPDCTKTQESVQYNASIFKRPCQSDS